MSRRLPLCTSCVPEVCLCLYDPVQKCSKHTLHGSSDGRARAPEVMFRNGKPRAQVDCLGT